MKRLYHNGGELMDAFVFGGTDIGNVPVNGKAGRHTLYWGESLFLGAHMHSIAYAQNPLDLQKGFATPGTEAKELFRPLDQLSGQAQITDTLSVAGQYLLEWEPARYPEGGTYLGPVDFVFNGPQRQFLSPALGFAANGGGVEPKQNGEFGLSARWSPQRTGRHRRLLLPPLRRQIAADAADRGRTQQQPLQPDICRQDRPVRRQYGQEHRRHQLRRRNLHPSQHPAERTGAGRRARPAGARARPRARAAIPGTRWRTPPA